MSSTGTPTPNYGLNQWVSTDKPQMQDFNNDNLAIDTALGQKANTADVNAALALKANIAQESWIAPTLLNGWTNVNPTVNDPAGYFKDALGIVHIKGLLAPGTLTPETPIFQLAQGYRPSLLKLFSAISYDQGTSSFVTALIGINIDGDVEVHVSGGTWLTLEGITFRVD